VLKGEVDSDRSCAAKLNRAEDLEPTDDGFLRHILVTTTLGLGAFGAKMAERARTLPPPRRSPTPSPTPSAVRIIQLALTPERVLQAIQTRG